MGRGSSSSSQALLGLEDEAHNPSSKESALLVCKRDDEELLKKLETAKAKANGPPDTKPTIAPPSKSQVLGKVRDFLGVMAEANKRLEVDAMEKSKNYDIEALTGEESEYIEMDLMLGVADLHTPAAVAAAESAMVGSRPFISLDGISSEDESEDSSDDESCSDTEDDDDDTDKGTHSPTKSRSKPLNDKSSSKKSNEGQRKKRPKIVELS